MTRLLIGLLFLVMTLLASSARAAQTLIQTDFGRSTSSAVASSDLKSTRVSGYLPDGWLDNSSWAKVWVDYRPQREGGRSFLRVEVTRLASGQAQFRHALPDVIEEEVWHLSFESRSDLHTALEIGVREDRAPYRFSWRALAPLTPQWQRFSYDFRMTPNRQAISLYLMIPNEGAVDLATLQLSRQTRQEYVQEMKSKADAQSGPRNLARLSRFPLGLQSGWSLDRARSDGDEVKIEPDPAAPGLSGFAALRIAAAGPWTLTTAPVGLKLPLEPHTASLFLRGEGTVRLAIVCDDHEIAAQNVKLAGAGQWTRGQVSFVPELLAKYAALRLSATGTVWLDALQVEAGREATAYAPPADCEVALACPPSDAAPARVQFVDEPAKVRFAVTGRPSAAAVLRARVEDVYGRQRDLPPMPLRQEQFQEGDLSFDPPPARPLGPMRIEAWVEDGQGGKISTNNELVVFRLRRPRYWGQDAPDSPFGVHTNSTTRHNLMAKAAGINWVRLHDAGLEYLGWSYLEPQPGAWAFRDEPIQRYRRMHLKILGELGTAPRWASYFPGKEHDHYFDAFYQPRRMADYANYVKVVAQRYRGVIDAYDVWNEPWNKPWWAVAYDESKSGMAAYRTSEHPAEDYARLMKTAYAAVKAVDPAITVLGFNTTSEPVGAGWTSAVLAAGGLDACDAIAFHHYTTAPGGMVAESYRAALGPILDAYGAIPKPVWMTEGSPVIYRLGPGMSQVTLPYSHPEDWSDSSDRVARYMVGMLKLGVRKMFFYSMHSHGFFGSPSDWRFLVTDEGYLHPSATAHAAAAWLLEDTHFVKTLTPVEGITIDLFESKDGSRSVAAIAPRLRHAAYAPPALAAAEWLDVYGNPLPANGPLPPTMSYLHSLGRAAALEAALTAK